MAKSKDGNGIWRITATTAIGVVITGAASWFSFGGGVTAAGVEKIHQDKSQRLITIQELHTEQIKEVRALIKTLAAGQNAAALRGQVLLAEQRAQRAILERLDKRGGE